MTNRNTIKNVTTEALTANTDKPLAWNGSDDRLILVIKNTGSSSSNITIKAGNGIQGVTDLILSAAAGINLVKLDSGRFKNVTGTNKGKIVVNGPATLEVAVVELA